MVDKNITFVTFYGFREYISNVKDEFERKNYNVIDIPYMTLKNDNHTDSEILDKIKNANSSIVFMFVLPPCIDFIAQIKESNKKIIFYNFDDPRSVGADLIKYSKGIDVFFTPNILSFHRLEHVLKSKLIHLPMFIESNINTNNEAIPKTLDICILCDEDYDSVYNSDKTIKSIKLMALDKKLTIRLLGYPELEYMFSDIYEGIYDVDNVIDMTQDSKIVIYLRSNMHTDKNDDVLITLMQHNTLIYVLYSKQIDHLIKPNYNSLIFDPNNVDQILDVLVDYDRYKIIAKNTTKHLEQFNLSRWVDDIMKSID